MKKKEYFDPFKSVFLLCFHFSALSTSAAPCLHALLRTLFHRSPAKPRDSSDDPGRPDAGHGNQRGIPHLPHIDECSRRGRSGMPFPNPSLLIEVF